jgi:FkbM family methyltransferase
VSDLRYGRDAVPPSGVEATMRAKGISMRVAPEFARMLTPKALRTRIRARQLTSDRESARRYVASESSSPPEGLVRLNMRALSGKPIWVRPRTSDLQVVRDTFLHTYHLPPPQVGDELREIWDLGSNIGTTVAHMCHLFSAARVVGVELDSENARLCRLNTAAWSERCQILEAAVWPSDGTVEYESEAGTGWSAAAREGGGRFARALPLNALLDDAVPRIDFVKMDIEGAEARVLRENTEWLERVRSIKVEVHGVYSRSDCIRDLQAHGFDARPNHEHPAGVVGLRED